MNENTIEIGSYQCAQAGNGCESDPETLDGSNTRTRVHTGLLYCSQCYRNAFMFQCYSCEGWIEIHNLQEHNGNDFCEPCAENEREHCDDCNGNNGGGFTFRPYSTLDIPLFQSTEAGKIITSPRIFSAEIEAYHNDNGEMGTVCEDLPRAYGISSDGSLNNNGVEFQTPKLQGKNGEQSIIDACRILNDNDLYTDTSTGLHVHLDASDYNGNTPRTIANLKQVWIFYLATEDVLLSFLPPSRRNNSYCKPMRNDYGVHEIEKARTITSLEKIWYRVQRNAQVADRKKEKYDPSRYAGINFHSLLANGHLEVRYHSGTLNAQKILEWVALHQAILDRATESRIGDRAKQFAAIPSLEEKTQKFFEILRLPERAQQYFLSRQKTFTRTAEDKNEDVQPQPQVETLPALSDITVNETPVCAE